MNTHHATVFEGDRSVGLLRAETLVTKTLGVSYHNNPDVVVAQHDQYAIEDARALKDRAYQAPLGAAQVFVLAFDRITLQAENALLKLLEEPAANTFFILIVPTVEILLPTVRSRLTYGGQVRGELIEAELARTFIGAQPVERVRLTEQFYKNVKEDQRLAARTRAVRFIDAIEAQLHERGVCTSAPALHEVLFVRRYLSDPSASLKMLLEHLAYSV